MRLLSSAIVLALTVLSIWAFQITQKDHVLIQFGMMTGLNFLAGGMLWLGYTAYAMHCLVPKADMIVDPELSEQLQCRGDHALYRAHRLCFYSFSSAFRWFNGRLHPEFDFKKLPPNLRFPLAAHCYGAWFVWFSMWITVVAFKLAEVWGLG